MAKIISDRAVNLNREDGTVVALRKGVNHGQDDGLVDHPFVKAMVEAGMVSVQDDDPAPEAVDAATGDAGQGAASTAATDAGQGAASTAATDAGQGAGAASTAANQQQNPTNGRTAKGSKG
jgi:hypothetical protein